MKGYGIWIFLTGILLCLILGWVIDKEMRFNSYRAEEFEISEEEALEAVPFLYLTEEEYALCSAIAELPMIQEVHLELMEEAARRGGETESRNVDGAELESYLRELLPEGITLASAHVTGGTGAGSIILDVWRDAEGESGDVRVLYSFLLSHPGQVLKVIGIGEDVRQEGISRLGNPDREVYSNNNNQWYTKTVQKRVWFSWLFQ